MNVMVKGRLSIRREGPLYRAHFDEQQGEHGAQDSLCFSDDQEVFDYLVSIQDPSMKSERPEDRAKQWMMELRNTESLVLDPVDLTKEQAIRYRPDQEVRIRKLVNLHDH